MVQFLIDAGGAFIGRQGKKLDVCFGHHRPRRVGAVGVPLPLAAIFPHFILVGGGNICRDDHPLFFYKKAKVINFYVH